MKSRTPKRDCGTLFGTEADESRNVSGRVVRVAMDTGADTLFDYVLPEYLGQVLPGQRVQVPFGKTNKLHDAFVVRIIEDADEAAQCRKFKLKSIKAVIDQQPLLNEQLMQLAQWISQYYVCPLGQVLSAMVPAAVKQDSGMKKQAMVYLNRGTGVSPVQLHGRDGHATGVSSAKQKAIVEILQKANATDIDSAMDKKKLLELADCTEAPLKQLHRKQLVNIAQKEILRALPVIPQGLSMESKMFELNGDQKNALSFVSEQVTSGGFGVSLLYGVTDSGKTEVYIRAIQACIDAGRQAIILLPEIALTAQTVQRFSSRFEDLTVLHSRLSGPQRNAQWQKIRSGRSNVVIGARSAVFAPLDRIGLIIVDEEHEPSYKQDTVPRYHGRDVAIKRAQLASAHCLLGSATPSLESFHNCQSKKHYTLLELPKRVMNLPMPQMKLVDLKTAFAKDEQRGMQLISPALAEQLRQVLARQEQAILLLNRRGYSNFIYCPSCRHSLTCRNCDATLTFHKRPSPQRHAENIFGRHKSGGYAICHYCLSKTLVPERCPLCGSGMIMIGLGSQRLEEELVARFPEARIRRIDSDSMEGEDYYALLNDFTSRKVDILAGTQILAKGLHFPNVTLVGIINADTALVLSDFRANERTFQIINQVAGRAGRSEKSGVVLVQSFFAGQSAIEYALKNDYKAFAEHELKHRQSCGLPPFGRIAVISMRDIKFDRLSTAVNLLKARVEGVIASEQLKIVTKGPLEPAVNRIQQQHRLNLILQSSAGSPLQCVFEKLKALPPLRPAVQTVVDMDPVGVL
ncbi:MAG: primosomal protein N' [Planctomycetaceae bacterium]|nr:primosomal protein N' [Planctomycetaceae bacterium]